MVELPSPSACHFVKPPVGSWMPSIWVLWGYWPRRIVARDGQQKE